ncbi:MAG: MMPL family transporter [Thermoanaerobaculia bacterium]|nr:MMPL family transporter [Thermoanaerobaculia bacterium]
MTVTDYSIQRPRTVYSVIALLVVVLGSFLTRTQIDTDPENMLPASQVDRLFHNEVKQRFALHDAIVVGMVNEEDPDGIFNPRSLTALHSLSRSILALEGVVAPDLMSLAQADNISQEGVGTLRFEWMMQEAPVTAQQAEEIREKVSRLPLLTDTLVSGDGKAAAIYVPIASKDLSYPLSLEIQLLTESLDSDDTFHITGLPVAEDTFGHDMFIQMGISAPLAGLMIFLLMLYFFRSVQLVTVPMLVAMATVIMSMGALTALGFSVHIMSSMIPIFLMPIAVVDSVHIMSEFADAYRPGDDARRVIRDVVEELFTPMLFTSVTSALGFLSLLLTPIPPVQVFGAFVAFGILVAFVLTITLIPAYVTRMSEASLAKLGTRNATVQNDGLLARLLQRVGRLSTTHGKLVIAIALLMAIVSAVGVTRIQINDNPVRWFKKNHPIRIADEVLNQHFAGTYDAFLVLTARNDKAVEEFQTAAEALLTGADATTRALLEDRLHPKTETVDSQDLDEYYGNLIAVLDDAQFEAEDPEQQDLLGRLMELAESAQSSARYFQRPESLRTIESLQQALGETGLVGKTNALPDIVKVVHRELRGGDPDDYRVPDTTPAVAQSLLQYQSSHRPQDLWHMVTPDFSSTAIWLQLKSGDNQDMTRVLEALDRELEDHPLPAGVELAWAGKSYINVVWQQSMVHGMLKSLLGAFLAVLVIMTLLFRSWKLGLLAMVPLSLTILGVYGAIGWIGKDYDMPIAVLSSLTLGLSVDFAIHFISRVRSLLGETGSFQAALEALFEEPARAIARNAIVIAIGFTPLFFAPLVPYITVGAFMAGIMAFSGLTTLVLLPAIVAWIGPWLFPNLDQETSK